MKQYNKPRVEIILAADVVTGSPETGFIPFNTVAAPLDVNILNSVDENLYEDVVKN